MPHAFEHADAFRRIQYREIDARVFEAQVHQHEIDIVKAAAPGLQRMRAAGFFFETHPHLPQVAARTPALPVALPIELLQLVQKALAAIRVARHHARLHIRHAFPRFGGLREVIFERSFRQHQRPRAAIGTQARVDREEDTLARIGGHQVDDSLCDSRPQLQPPGILVVEHEHQIGVRSQIEFAHAQPPQRHHPHLLRARDAGLGHRDLIGARDHRVRHGGSADQSVEHRFLQADAGGLNAHHFAAVPAAQLRCRRRRGNARTAAVLERPDAGYFRQ